MSSSFGSKIRLSIFGESHGPAIGCLLEGLPPGTRLDPDVVNAFLARRAPGSTPLGTPRRESDTPEFLSGLQDGVLTGAPLCAVIRNNNCRSRDYSDLKVHPRPGHADYTAHVKYNGANDVRGGGNFSGRLTAPLCIAGAVALQILASKGIHVGAHIAEIAGIVDRQFDPVNVDAAILASLDAKALPVLDDEAGAKMTAAVIAAREQQDSVGGIVEVAAVGLPAGLGNPIYDGMENILSRAFFAIPAVKGVEFGEGFNAARLTGSVNNDAFIPGPDGTVRTATNHCGGILGGITTGMPLLARVAFKPTPSIAREQQTVNLTTGQPAAIKIEGRHDPCVVPRAVPAVIAATAVALLDAVLQ
ncbi:MAG: chorismate synthase [Victivallales bacterium]|nr:chorismate synthase [Victivallales bacterium]